MAQEPEDREAMLARMRQERDVDNAVTLRESDANRGAWLAQVEAALARLRTPTEQAKAYGAALFERLADYFRELVGHEPWAWTAMGKVLRVDRPTKTCRVQIAADALNPAAVAGQRKISYGFAAPRVGQTVPVHFPTRVTRSGPLEAEPDPEHLPWCKVPGGALHWLYYEQWSFFPLYAKLYRVQWPVTVIGPNDGELCCDLPVSSTLGAGYPVVANFDGIVGYHTGTRTLYLAATPWDSLTLTDEGTFPGNKSTWLMRVEDWGFGPATARDLADFSTVDAVLDDPGEVAAAVVLSGTDFVATSVTWTDTDGTGAATAAPATTISVRVSQDTGAAWDTVASYEYVRAVKYHEPPTAVTFTAQPTRWPFIYQPWQRNTVGWAKRTGFVTLADTLLGPAGTRVQLLPRFHEQPTLTDGSPYWQLNDLTLAAYFPDSNTYTELPITFPHQVWGNPLHNDIFNNVQICQADDGTFVVYAVLASGASNVEQYQVVVGPPPTVTAPAALYRGRGALDALEWTQIGDAWDSAIAPFGVFRGIWDDPISPWIVLSASADGASLLAYTIGTLAEGDTDNHQLIGSDDFGDTWAALPGGWQPSDIQGSPGFRPMYFVDIPDNDPRAAPATGGG